MAKLCTVRDLIFWSYANLAMAQDGVSRSLVKYDRISFIIRSRLFKGLSSGTMQIHSLFDDEKAKIENGAKCVYCGGTSSLSIDHILPRHSDGSDSSDNLVCCCKACNSSKGDRNLVEWYLSKDDFPPLMILRRYLKLIYQICIDKDILARDIEYLESANLPFKQEDIPINYPSPDKCASVMAPMSANRGKDDESQEDIC